MLSSEGVDLIDATIALKEGNPVAANGVLNYLASGHNLTAAHASPSGIVINRIPFSAEITAATPVAVQFHFRSTDAVKTLQPKRLLDALYAKGTGSALGFVDVNPPELASAK